MGEKNLRLLGLEEPQVLTFVSFSGVDATSAAGLSNILSVSPPFQSESDRQIVASKWVRILESQNSLIPFSTASAVSMKTFR